MGGRVKYNVDADRIRCRDGHGAMARYYPNVGWRTGFYSGWRRIYYLEGRWEALQTRIEPVIFHWAPWWANWNGLSFRDLYAARYSAVLNIPANGYYDLCITSDDASLLYLDSLKLVDNDGI